MISVVIPSYNHAAFIGEAVESVLRQTYSNLELIIIDDGSKDHSVEVIKQFRDPRIKLITQENAGAHNAINRGMAEAKGELIAILNSDDRFAADRFEKLIEYFKRDPELGLACTYLNLIDVNGNQMARKRGWENLEPWPLPDKSKSFTRFSHFPSQLICGNFVATTSNMLFRKEVLNEVGGGMANLRFSHDWDFALRVALKFRCTLVPEFLMDYRLHGSNTIRTNQAWLNVENAWIWATYLPKVVSNLMANRKELGIEKSDIVESFYSSANFLKLEPLILLIRSLSESEGQSILENPEMLQLLINASKQHHTEIEPKRIGIRGPAAALRGAVQKVRRLVQS